MGYKKFKIISTNTREILVKGLLLRLEDLEFIVALYIFSLRKHSIRCYVFIFLYLHPLEL